MGYRQEVDVLQLWEEWVRIRGTTATNLIKKYCKTTINSITSSRDDKSAVFPLTFWGHCQGGAEERRDPKEVNIHPALCLHVQTVLWCCLYHRLRTQRLGRQHPSIESRKSAGSHHSSTHNRKSAGSPCLAHSVAYMQVWVRSLKTTKTTQFGLLKQHLYLCKKIILQMNIKHLLLIGLWISQPLLRSHC